MFDTFYLNEGQDTAVFLANLADAEAALQGELGYLGRNLEWGHDGRFSIQVCTAPGSNLGAWPGLNGRGVGKNSFFGICIR